MRGDRGARTDGVDGVKPASIVFGTEMLLSGLRDDLKTRRFVPARSGRRRSPNLAARSARFGDPSVTRRVIGARARLVRDLWCLLSRQHIGKCLQLRWAADWCSAGRDRDRPERGERRFERFGPLLPLRHAERLSNQSPCSTVRATASRYQIVRQGNRSTDQ